MMLSSYVLLLRWSLSEGERSDGVHEAFDLVDWHYRCADIESAQRLNVSFAMSVAGQILVITCNRQTICIG